MAMIINDPSPGPELVYNDEVADNRQFDVDNSTVDKDTEMVYVEFAKHASQYAVKAKKGKIYDFKTKNASFLSTYNDLYHLGVKNNKFHLTLFDRDLQGVDPYSPVLPKDLQIKIFLETLINPWYFLREILRIPVDGLPLNVGGGVQYNIDRNNIACWYLFLNGVDHYQSKPRQRGKTQDAVGKFNYAYNFGNLSSTMLFFNKDQSQANENLYRLKCQRDMFPTYLQMKFVVEDNGKVNKGTDNTKSMKNPVTGNIIKTMGKATGKESAMKLGRGATAALQYMDEFDFTPYQTEIMRASSFAFSTASKNAKTHGSLYARILTSTPGDLDTRDGKEATEYVSKMLVWKDSMFDEPIEKLKKILYSPAYNRFVFVEHTWRQLKLSMEWYEEQCGLVSFDPETIMREIDLKRIHGSSNSPFSRAALLYILNHKKDPISTMDLSNNLCEILIYEKLYINKPYIMVIDPSEGLGSDSNAMVLINPVTLKCVAEFQSPYISQPALFKMLCTFMKENCQACMIIVENNRGREIINLFMDSEYYPQLYYDDKKLGDKVIEKTDPYGRLKRESQHRRSMGLTTGSNRPQYFAILENLMEERRDLVCTEYIVKDVCGLIRQANGKVVAGPGSHDDIIMAYLMGLFVYNTETYERLSEYGIIRGASENVEDYDEAGGLTETAVHRKLIEMADNLPDNMRELIMENLKQRSPITDAREAAKDKAYAQSILAPTREEVLGGGNNRDILNNQAPSNVSFYANYDESTMRSNMDDDYYSRSGAFDIEDYL